MSILPFEAAIFDLDGTLLDSLYVWKRVDEIFFSRRGIIAPKDYGAAVAGLSYTETADYTIERFSLNDTREELIGEWMALAADEYANRVRLKSGAKEYLTFLKGCGVKIAVATAMPASLFMPCLEHLGVTGFFEVLCSTEDTGGRGKKNGEIYRLAAERLGVPCERCAVFEDVLPGIEGAVAAGMRPYCVWDDSPGHDHAAMEAICGRSIHDLRELIPERAVILTAYCEGDVMTACGGITEKDLILCADWGYRMAQDAGLTPDRIIGDFDSGRQPEGCGVIVHPVMKDDTDTMLCARFALSAGIGNIHIVGGIGGRMDHTLANLQTLAFIARAGAKATLYDGRRYAAAVCAGSVRIPRSSGKFSVFSLDSRCEGVFIRGAKYNLKNGVITCDFPIGAGNDFTEDFAEIGTASGIALIIREDRAE